MPEFLPSPEVIRPQQNAWIAAEPRTESQEELFSAGLLEYGKLVLRRKYLILAIVLTGGAIGFLASLSQPFLFKAIATVEIQAVNEAFMGTTADPQAANLTPTEINIQTQLKLVDSQSVRGPVLERLGRELTPSAVPTYSDPLARLRRKMQDVLGRTPKDPLATLRQALGTAAGTLGARVVKGTRIIEIACESTSPEVSAAFANGVANEYIEQSMDARLKSSQRTTQWLTKQLKEARERLEKSEEKLRAETTAAGHSATPDQPQDSLRQAKIVRLQIELSAIDSEIVDRQTKYQRALAAGDTLPDAAQDAVLAPYRAKLSLLRRELETLSATLTPAHYKVKKVQADIADTEALMKTDRETIIQRTKADLDTVIAREKMLSKAYTTQLHAINAQSSKTTDLSLLQREVELNRQIFQVMLQQLNQTGIAASLPTTNIRIVDMASPPRKPSNLTQTVYTGLGSVTGLLLGLMLAMVLQHNDRSVREPGHASTLLNLPELGVVPARVEEGWMHNVLHRKKTLQVLPDTAANGTQSIELVTWYGKLSPLAESFRSTLASIVLRPAGGGGLPKVLVITSPNGQEGKSTVAVNLAIALLELNRRVLLVDADLRRPRLHEIFHLSNDEGLTDLTEGDKPLQHVAAYSAIKATHLPGLSVLTSGPTTSTIGNILYSERLRELLRALRQEYDVVLIDTPPMLQFSDARVLAHLGDAAILVLRAGSTDRDSALAARQRLVEDGTRLLGTVLNDWRTRRKQDLYYQQYYNQTR